MGLQAYGGRDVEELCRECDDRYREYIRTVPSEVLEFNTKVSTFGNQWCDVVSDRMCLGLFVVAGVSGNMTGVPIAEFPRSQYEAAKRYAKDFEQGQCFAIQNGPRWCDYINAMQAARKIDSHKYQRLISLGRSTGISSVTGNTITQSQLFSGYLSGKSAVEI